jgi:tRNA dimethylallyltransferase
MVLQEKPTVIALVGPTASGKTALSLSLAAQLNAEIIACDSRTVYLHFDIGTAKPTKEEQSAVRHHLIDVADPNDNFTAADFAEQAQRAIADIVGRGKVPIVAGGTGFYARALLEGLNIPQVPAQEELRKQLREFADAFGNQALHDRLKAVDPDSALRLGVNDRFRIIRALEVHTVLGVPMSAAAGRIQPPFNCLWIGLTVNDRQYLHDTIKRRFFAQMEQGLLEETARLLACYGESQKLMHTVNYKELVQLLAGRIDARQAHTLAVQHNIQLARRQLIWFRANRQITWFPIDTLDAGRLCQAVSRHIKDALPA